MASEGKIILSYHDVVLRQSDVAHLEPRQWLNDMIISFWFEYLPREVYPEYRGLMYFMPPEMVQFIKASSSNETSSEELSSMLNPKELASKKVIFFPINDSPTDSVTVGGSHWSLLVFNGKSGSFEHYDSFTGSVNHVHAECVFRAMAPILADVLGKKESDLQFAEKDCTQQENGYDCGVHLLCNSDAICRRMFRSDNRHMFEIASSAAIKRMRKEIQEVVAKLCSKT